VRAARVRTREDVFSLAQIVRWVEHDTAFCAPSVKRDSLRGLPSLPFPPVKENGDDLALSEPPLKAPVQLVLIPRHDQKVQDRRTGWIIGAFRADRHFFSPRLGELPW
jgi:hypothetical protein